MRSIFEAEMKCQSCGWHGTVGTCGDVEHDDGCLDCPVCHSVVIDDSPEVRQHAEKQNNQSCSACKKTEKTVHIIGEDNRGNPIEEFLCKDCAVKAGWEPSFVCSGCEEPLEADETFFVNEESFCVSCAEDVSSHYLEKYHS